MIKLIVLFIAIAIEVILGFFIIKNPEKVIGEGKSNILIKLFIFILLAIMIVVLLYLTIPGIKGLI